MQPSSYGCTREVAKHERSVRVARGVAESNSSFLSALQTPQVLCYKCIISISALTSQNLVSAFFADMERCSVQYEASRIHSSNIAPPERLTETVW